MYITQSVGLFSKIGCNYIHPVTHAITYLKIKRSLISFLIFLGLFSAKH